MAYFVIYVDTKGYFRWRLVAGNGEIVASGEAYTSKENAVRAVKRIKELAANAPIYEA